MTTTGKARYGVDIINGKLADLAAKGIYEPLAVKEQIVNASAEGVCMILRIDNIIAPSKPKDTPKPGGYGGGMSGDMGDIDI